jgi:hypothetical protein
LTPSPILKVLSTLTTHQVRHLLMGGQACVLYGAAEFSRDTDVAILAEPDNLFRLSRALAELAAGTIAVPPFSRDYLERGHAVHFRCQHPDAAGQRLDVMAVMRGVAPFAELWQRRTTLEVEGGQRIEVMSLPDLVTAKKTQRNKDWSMIRRLVEGNYARHRDNPTPVQVAFWLREGCTVSMLREVAQRFPQELSAAAAGRPLLNLAVGGEEAALTAALEAEEKTEREADRAYWAPLRAELEQLRHARRKP